MEFTLKNPALLLVAVVLFAILVALCILWLLPALIKRGVDVSGIVDKANITLTALDTVADMIGKLFPNAPMGIVDKVLSYAQEAVRSAEQMYKAGTVKEENRKQAATDLIYSFLTAAGIEITEELKPVIDGAIEAAVWVLPKTHEDK